VLIAKKKKSMSKNTPHEEEEDDEVELQGGDDDVPQSQRRLKYPSEEKRVTPLVGILIAVIVILSIITVIAVAIMFRESSQLSAYQANDIKLAKQKSVLQELYRDVVWPKSRDIVLNGSLPGVFKKGCAGRINPLGTFDDDEETLEYFYALAGPVIGNLGYRVIATNLLIVESLGDDKWGIRVDLLFENQLVPAPWTQFNLTQIGFFRFDPVTNLIVSYDLSIENMGRVPWTLPQDQAIQMLCGAAQQECVGPNQQFANYTACSDFMYSIPFGTNWIAGSNSVVCRMVHIQLAVVRPSVHCPHVGPTGGMKCIDFTYQDYYNWYL